MLSARYIDGTSRLLIKLDLRWNFKGGGCIWLELLRLVYWLEVIVEYRPAWSYDSSCCSYPSRTGSSVPNTSFFVLTLSVIAQIIIQIIKKSISNP